MKENVSKHIEKSMDLFIALFRLSILVVLTIILIATLSMIQNAAARKQQQEISASALEVVAETLGSNHDNAEAMTRIFHEINQSTLEDLKAMMLSGSFDILMNGNSTDRIEVFHDIISISGVKCLYLIDSNGKVLLAPVTDYFGQSLLDRGILTKDNLALLKKGTWDGQTVTPIFESNEAGDNYFYSTSINSQGRIYYLILEADSNILDIQFSSINDITRVIQNYTIDETSFMFVASRVSGKFIYFDNTRDRLTGANAADHGIPESAVTDGFSGILTIDGKDYYCVSKEVNPSTIIFDAKATSELYKRQQRMIVLTAVVFPMVVILCIGLMEVLTIAKLIPIIISFLAVVFCTSLYGQTMMGISCGVENAEIALERIEPRIAENIQTRDLVQNYYDERFLNKAMMLAYYLEEEPSVLNSLNRRTYSDYDENGVRHAIMDSEGNPLTSVPYCEALIRIAEHNNIADILIYDEQGHVICTTEPEWYFTLSHDPTQQSYSFREVVDEKRDYYIQSPQVNDIGVFREYIGTAFYYFTTKDEDGNTLYVSAYDYGKQLKGEWEGEPITQHRSMVQIGLDTDLIDFLGSSTNIGTVLSDVVILDGGAALGFETEDEHRVVHSPIKSNIGKTAEEIGMSPLAFSGNYNGFYKLNGRNYLQCVRMLNSSYYVAAMIPVESLRKYRTPVTVATTLLGMIYLLVMLIISRYYIKTEGMPVQAETLRQMAENANVSRIRDAMQTVSPAQASKKQRFRWGTNHKKWSQKNREEKARELLKYAIVLILSCILVLVTYTRYGYDEISAVSYVFTDYWDKGFNIFALSACLYIMSLLYVLISISNRLITFVTGMMGSKTETLGQLLNSVLKYGSAIICLFYCLHTVGVDSSSLLASAGIMSVVIGLGAQKLIGDIVAGIFIIFEGEFIVGEIVNINGFRGQVLDIGLRTTKLIDEDMNIKIFNNSEISGVMNMNRELSLVKCLIPLDYAEDLSAFEKMIEREGPTIRKNLPKIIQGPIYKHVTEFEGSDIQVRVDVLCHEEDVVPLQRQFNQQIYEALLRNNIVIPYGRIVVEYAKDATK